MKNCELLSQIYWICVPFGNWFPFESEAEMIGSRMVPALMESEEEFKATFT